MAMLFKTNGEKESVKPSNGSEFSLEELQGYVGGYVEPLYLSDDEAIVMDEEGLLKQKPVNEYASRAFGRRIVGDVLYGWRNELGV